MGGVKVVGMGLRCWCGCCRGWLVAVAGTVRRLLIGRSREDAGRGDRGDRGDRIGGGEGRRGRTPKGIRQGELMSPW